MQSGDDLPLSDAARKLGIDDTLRAVIRASPLPIVSLDVHGNVTSWNPAAERTFGWTEEEVLGRPSPTVPPDQKEASEGVRLKVLEGETATGLERARVRKDGTPIEISIATAPLYDADGRVTGTVLLALDITEQKRAERALRESEERYRSVVETSPDGIGVSDLQGRLTMVNQRAVELFGYPDKASMLGMSVYDLIVPEDRARAAENIRKRAALEELQGRNVEYTLVRADGSTFPADVSSTVILDDEGRPCALTIVARDITDRRRAEDQQRALERQKDAFLSAAAHDLRTPLTTLKGRAQLLQRFVSRIETPEVERLMDGLAQIDTTASRMTALINELLDASRLQAGKPLELDRSPVELIALVRHVLTEHEQASGRHTVVFEPQVDAIVGMWDQTRLERVVSNLLTNAVKYSPIGGRIELWVDRDGAEAVLTIQDDGVGILDEDLPHIFDRFFRGSNVTGITSGTGIGLSAARQIVQEHGGTIEAESRLGHGSTFTVRLPLEA